MSTRQKIQNVPRWPTVTAPANLPNVSGSPTQSSQLEVGDECYVTGTVNALYVCTTATLGAGVWVPYVQLAGQLGGTAASPDVRGIRETSGPTLLTMGAVADGQVLARSGSTVAGIGIGPYTLLWKWNGTDLTEFDQVGDGSFAYTVTTWGARNSTDDPTPAIRMDNPATSGGFSALLIKAALLPSIPNNFRYLFVARMQNSTSAGTQDPLVIPYYESPTYFIAARRTASNYAWCLREGSTTYVDPGVTYGSLSTNTDGAVHPYEFLLSPATGAQKPWLEMLVNRFSVVAAASSIPRARSAYAAGWTGLGSYAPRIGFGMRSFGSAAASGNCIADIEVYKVQV